MAAVVGKKSIRKLATALEVLAADHGFLNGQLPVEPPETTDLEELLHSQESAARADHIRV
jgi:hypothetical protein